MSTVGDLNTIASADRPGRAALRPQGVRHAAAHGEKPAPSGFTLMETMVVMALVALLSAWSVPGWIRLQRELALDTAALRLQNTFAHARSQALLRRQPVVVEAAREPQGDQARWEYGWTTFVDADGDHQRGPDELLLARSPALPGFLSVKAAFSGFGSTASLAIRYGTAGTLSPINDGLAMGHVEIWRNDADPVESSRRIVVTRTGRIRACVPAGLSRPC
ncbi:GspH/FimT family pseudopilin [Comamonadaceae bacterium PP-2]